jgi:Spy/CpxP family protein refolding chaperone
MKPTVFAGITALLAATLFIATGTAGEAQGPIVTTKFWTSDVYKRELNITPEQSRRLEEIFQAAVPKQKALKKALDEAEALFEQLAAQGDKKGAAEQINRVIAARGELMKSHSLMLLDMRFELTPEQWTKLGVLQQQANERARAAEKSTAAEKAKAPEKGK